MKKQTTRLASVSTVAALFSLGHLIGCAAPAPSDTASDDTTTLAALRACNLDDGTVEHNAHIRACDPQDHKKTTICHVPPGNPANAHTLCIGNAAVSAHLHNHDDYLGPCKRETRCPPPPSGGNVDAGSGGDPGTGGAGGPGGSAGNAGGGTGQGGASGGGAGGAGGVTIVIY